MKLATHFGTLFALASVAFAGKCNQPAPEPQYSATTDAAPTSSAPSAGYTATTEASSPVAGYTTTATAAAESSYNTVPPAPEYTTEASSPVAGYTTVENPYSTVPMPSEYSTEASSPVAGYTTVVNPYSTVPMPSEYSTEASSPVAGYTTVVNPYSTVAMPSEYSTEASSPVAGYTTVVNPYSTVAMPSEYSTEAEPSPTYIATPNVFQVSLDQLDAAIPDRKGDGGCSTASFPDECVPNSRAVAAINNALTKYGITKRSEAVAVISLMAFESGNWLYNINHWPGRPGQGTRNMQMANFNREYAQLLHPAEAAQVISSAADAQSDETSKKLLELVLNDNDSFGSGFWYLATKATGYFASADKLRDGNADDFKDYIVNGVNAGWDEGRQTVWNAVNSAIKA
ncbi:hypothetical protein GGI07_001749 [Coemansia sp. Benny D115]|nr:hypothetical protein GGI07_001749 [Coemansia sp. Benny D115]